MYNSFGLIQSKQTFQIQKYGSSILLQTSKHSNSIIQELSNCCKAITLEMLNYNEDEQLEKQIEILERFTFYIAQFSALLPHLPHGIVLFPSAEDMSRQLNNFYLKLLNECARKKQQFTELNKYN